MLTAPNINPPAFEIEANDVAALPVAHFIFNDENRSLWPLDKIGFVEDEAVGGPLVMCGGCGNVIYPNQVCEGCGCVEPYRNTLPCNGEGCENGFVTIFSWTQPTREERCRCCDGSGRIDAPYAHHRADFDLGIENDLSAWAQAGLDLSCAVPPPAGWFQPISVRGWGAA